ncbi:MAG: hypothetical protein QOH97_5782 [Actinoplanes sp.]|nr:hypothetical protein [Actinoplanes sp.]
MHDIRVATRRLRSILRAFRPLLERERTEPLRDELHSLAERLGEVRDEDVMAQRLTAAMHAEPPELVLGPVAAQIQSQLVAHSARARVALVEALDSDRYQWLLTHSAALTAPLPSGVPKKRLRRLARKAVRRADARLAAADRADPDQRDTRLPAARRAYQRARYAAEALRPVGRPSGRRASPREARQDPLPCRQAPGPALAPARNPNHLRARRSAAVGEVQPFTRRG